MSSNPIAVNYGGVNQPWNMPTRNMRNNTSRVRPKNKFRSSNVQQHTNHYLPEKRQALPQALPQAPQMLEKRANTWFTPKSKIRNYSPAVLKSAHAPQHALFVRNTGTRKLSHTTRSIRTNGIRKLFRKSGG